MVWSDFHHMQIKNMAKIKSLIICQGKVLRKSLNFTEIWNWKRGHSKHHKRNKTQNSYFYQQHSKILLNVKMSTWMHPMFCLIADFKTHMLKFSGTALLLRLTWSKEKTKKKIYYFSLYNGVSGQTYNFFSKPTFFFVSVSFSFFCHCWNNRTATKIAG